ncbi:hypothetical protein ACQ3G5_28725 [Rhizobium sp. 12,4]
MARRQPRHLFLPLLILCKEGQNTGTHQDKRLMLEAEIPAFVDDVIATGCDICALGHDGYVVGDADLSDEEYEIAGPKLARIKDRYGDRDHLLREIAIELRSLGRHHDLVSPPVYWSDNSKGHEES